MCSEARTRLLPTTIPSCTQAWSCVCCDGAARWYPPIPRVRAHPSTRALRTPLLDPKSCSAANTLCVGHVACACACTQAARDRALAQKCAACRRPNGTELPVDTQCCLHGANDAARRGAVARAALPLALTANTNGEHVCLPASEAPPQGRRGSAGARHASASRRLCGVCALCVCRGADCGVTQVVRCSAPRAGDGGMHCPVRVR